MFVCTIVIVFPVQAYKNNDLDLEVGQGSAVFRWTVRSRASHIEYTLSFLCGN